MRRPAAGLAPNRLPDPMALGRKPLTAFLCASALVLAAGCGDDQGVGGQSGEPHREGLSVELEGVEYTVYITRELNLKTPPDQAYYNGPEAPPGQAYFGVFLQVCNPKGPPKRTAEHFKVLDNQGNEFEPTEVEENNPFAYHPRTLSEKRCIPQAGSVAQLGPTEASMLLFKLPLSNTENRPLELEIEGPTEGGSEAVELDL
jgi:hypothetical protein